MKNRFYLCLGTLALLTACAQEPGQNQAQGPAPETGTIGPSTLNVADAAIAGGDPGMALSVSQSILATDPGNADALIHEGDAYYALSRCPASEAAYTLALKTDPKSAAAETGLGRCLIKTDPKSAEAAFMAAVQDDPGNADAYNDLGIARDLQGNFAGAVQPYQQALQDDPGMTAAEVNLGLSLALSGNGPEALQYLGPLATGQNATPKIREDYAAALVASGRDSEARQVLSIDLPPDQVNSAMDGFNAVIAGGQAPLPSPNASIQPATTPEVATASVSAASIPPAAPQPLMQAASAPAPTTVVAAPPAPPPVQATQASYTPAPAAPASAPPDNSTGAYEGPSPVPGAISSSTPGPTEQPAVAAPPAPTPAPPPPPQMAAAAPVSNTADNANGAYEGPSPVPGAISSSTPGPTATPPAAIPAVAAASPPPPPSTPSTPVAPGTYQVQLGSLPSQADAQADWDKISAANPSLFSDKQPNIVSATVNGTTYYRLRTGSFSNAADAAKFCGEVSASGSPCTLADF